MVRRDYKRSLLESVKYAAGLSYRREATRVEGLTSDEFWEYQGAKLLNEYSRAKQNIPFYHRSPEYPRQLKASEGVLASLRTLPVLPKSVVRSNPELFQPTRRPILSATHTTGGTTGTPLRVRAGFHERGATNAIVERRYLATSGARYPRMVRLSGYLSGDELWRKIPGTRIAYLSIYGLTSDNRAQILKHLRDLQPQAFHGYASALRQLARVVDGEHFSTSNPIAAVSTSETLDESVRSEIETQLGVTVHNEYGSQEGQHSVLECAERGLHIHPMRGIVEILDFDTDRPARIGEPGRVVVTGLLSRQMPLLRYEIGDSAVSLGYRTGCACGSQWPQIGKVFGRTEDLIKLADGRRVGLLSHSTLKDVTGVRESQIVQRSFTALKYLLCVEPGVDNAAIERHVRHEVHSRLGEDMTVEFEYVDSIERTPAGKIQAVRVLF